VDLKDPHAPGGSQNVFVCAVCRARWKDHEELIMRGHDFGEQRARDRFDEFERKAGQ
jgi:hypothetical protein